jgi:hypothetical protein
MVLVGLYVITHVAVYRIRHHNLWRPTARAKLNCGETPRFTKFNNQAHGYGSKSAHCIWILQYLVQNAAGGSGYSDWDFCDFSQFLRRILWYTKNASRPTQSNSIATHHLRLRNLIKMRWVCSHMKHRLMNKRPDTTSPLCAYSVNSYKKHAKKTAINTHTHLHFSSFNRLLFVSPFVPILTSHWRKFLAKLSPDL